MSNALVFVSLENVKFCFGDIEHLIIAFCDVSSPSEHEIHLADSGDADGEGGSTGIDHRTVILVAHFVFDEHDFGECGKIVKTFFHVGIEHFSSDGEEFCGTFSGIFLDIFYCGFGSNDTMFKDMVNEFAFDNFFVREGIFAISEENIFCNDVEGTDLGQNGSFEFDFFAVEKEFIFGVAGEYRPTDGGGSDGFGMHDELIFTADLNQNITVVLGICNDFAGIFVGESVERSGHESGGGGTVISAQESVVGKAGRGIFIGVRMKEESFGGESDVAVPGDEPCFFVGIKPDLDNDILRVGKTALDVKILSAAVGGYVCGTKNCSKECCGKQKFFHCTDHKIKMLKKTTSGYY